jgi:hypothetical protein
MQQTDLSSVDIRVNVELNLDFFFKDSYNCRQEILSGNAFSYTETKFEKFSTGAIDVCHVCQS